MLKISGLYLIKILHNDVLKIAFFALNSYTYIIHTRIDAFCGKTVDRFSQEPQEIGTCRTTHFEDNRLNCVVI